jgi:hypothetical protein
MTIFRHTARVPIGHGGRKVEVQVLQQETHSTAILLAQMPFTRAHLPSLIETSIIAEAIRIVSQNEHLDTGPQVTLELLKDARDTFKSIPPPQGTVRRIGVLFQEPRSQDTTVKAFVQDRKI